MPDCFGKARKIEIETGLWIYLMEVGLMKVILFFRDVELRIVITDIDRACVLDN